MGFWEVLNENIEGCLIFGLLGLMMLVALVIKLAEIAAGCPAV